MNRVLHIARREWLELNRQPAMVAVMALLFLAIAVLSIGALLLLEAIAADPSRIVFMEQWLPEGVEGRGALDGFTGVVVGAYNWLIFTQFLGIAAVLAGHTVLHDRETAALPFLLLAPVRRAELLAGKVLGASAIPFVLYLGLSGGASAVAAVLSVTAPFADRLPPSPGWMIAFFLGGPAWALFIGTVCAVVSAIARDVRTAQQGVWFVMFFATFAAGFLLAALLPSGALVQLAVAGLGAVATAAALAVGSQVVSRDLTR